MSKRRRLDDDYADTAVLPPDALPSGGLADDISRTRTMSLHELEQMLESERADGLVDNAVDPDEAAHEAHDEATLEIRMSYAEHAGALHDLPVLRDAVHEAPGASRDRPRGELPDAGRQPTEDAYVERECELHEIERCYREYVEMVAARAGDSSSRPARNPSNKHKQGAKRSKGAKRSRRKA